MARRKKTKAKKAGRIKPTLICGILLSAIGILFIIIAILPASVGTAGRFLHERFLSVVFGRASVPTGLYCMGLGFVLLITKKKAKYFYAFTCLFVPVLVAIDALFSTTQETEAGAVVEHGAYIGYILRSTAANFVGSAGLVLLCCAFALCGIFLLTPKRVLKGFLHRLLALLRPKKLSPTGGITEKTVSENGTSPFAPDETVPQSSTEAKPAQLKLELYNREFVKIPSGLFEEQTAFNTSLPVGTRRQEIIDAFASVNITVDIGEIRRGPSFEQYEIIPGIAVKAAQIRSRIEDVSLRIKQKVHISRKSGGILAIEVPLAERQTVPYGFLLENTADDDMEIPIAVGVDACFAPFSVDLVELPHLLIAGTTGSGKSIFLKTLIASIMYHLTPDEVRLVLIDPKRVEFGIFSSSLFCACDIITDFEKVPQVFEALVSEMEARYELLESAGVSGIRQYNAGVEPQLRRPYIVVVVDEFADLLMQNVEGFEDAIIRLAQKARASGIHLVMATQRPSADIIRGLLKTNIPGRIALTVSSQVDSKIILDTTGAESLTGKGDLICICPAFRDGIRLQGAYISNEEIRKIIDVKS
jgi:energy-coupling factor transporter ATP-binding protein EcfA2